MKILGKFEKKKFIQNRKQNFPQQRYTIEFCINNNHKLKSHWKTKKYILHHSLLSMDIKFLFSSCNVESPV